MGQDISQDSRNYLFCYRTNDPLRLIHDKHLNFCKKMRQQCSRKYYLYPWSKTMLQILDQFRDPKSTLFQLKTEVRRQAFDPKNFNEHYSASVQLDDITPTNQISFDEENSRDNFRSELMDQCIFDKSLEVHLQTTYKFKRGLYNNNSIVNNLANNYDYCNISFEQQRSITASLNQYKAVTTTIEKHVKQEGNILSAAFRDYQDYFSQYYQLNEQDFNKILAHSPIQLKKRDSGSSLEGSKQASQFGSLSQSVKTVDTEKEKWKVLMLKAVEDLKSFILFFTSLIINFYELISQDKNQKNPQQPYIISLENILNFTVSMLFSQPQIHEPLIELHHKGLIDTNKFIQNYIDLYHEKHISSFDIEQRFSLDKTTVTFINSKLAKEAKNERKSANIQRSPFFGEDKNYVPYGKAIEFFRNIQIVQSPIHKLKVLVQTCEWIDHCIKEFYENYRMNSADINYDADQFITIIIYIISKAGIKNIGSHIKIIQNFAIKNTWNSSAGYILTSFNAAIQHMSDSQKKEESQKSL